MYYIYFCMLGIFLSSSLFLTEQFNAIGNYLIIAFIILLVCSNFFINIKEFPINKYYFTIVYIMVLWNFVGSIFRPELNLLLNNLALMFLFFSTQVISSLNYFKNSNDNMILMFCKILFYSQFFLVILSFLQYDISFNSYQGIFGNPNSYGIIATTLFVCYLAFYTDSLGEYFESGTLNKTFFFRLIFAFLLFINVSLTQSTTSLLACVVAIITIHVIILIKMIYFRKKVVFFMRFIKIYIPFAFIVFFISLISDIDEQFLEAIFAKFKVKMERGDLLNSRGEIWSNVFESATLFGHGSVLNIDAHNTFIKILSELGYGSLIIFSVLIISFLSTSLKHIIVSDSKLKFLPFLLTITFITLSMGESMMFSLPMNAMFLSMGFIISVRRQARL